MQVMVALGEMSAYLPHKKGFPGYATRFVDPAFGFAVRAISGISILHLSKLVGCFIGWLELLYRAFTLGFYSWPPTLITSSDYGHGRAS